VRVTVDDATTIETEAWLVAVGNTRTYASGMMITPAASVHDGLLDVCVVGPVSRVDFLRTFPSVFKGTHVEHPQVRTARGTNVTIEALDATAAVDLWASGEHAGPLPAHLEPAPGALAVVVPR
jgi:diacylglycerol kinase (ATP)